MSVFAGIYGHDQDGPIDQRLCSSLERSVSRSAENTMTEFSWPGAYIIQADIGAFCHESYCERDGDGVLIVAGQLLVDSASGNDRRPEIEKLARHFARDVVEIGELTRARGTFCLVDYSERRHRLVVAVDRVGVRPLYYYDDGHTVIFSTVLRVFESLADNLNLEVDFLSMSEMNTYGYCLDRRTPFRKVERLRGGEGRLCIDRQTHDRVYWRWDRVAECDKDQEEAGRDLHSAFVDAIRIRLGEDEIAYSFLSGGLDSRCIVTALKSLGISVHTFNMSWHKSYDEVIAEEFARQIGTCHHSMALPDDQAGWAWPRIIATALHRQGSSQNETGALRPGVIWSGDGGSVGLGSVYLTKDMVDILRSGNVAGAVQEFCDHNSGSSFDSGILKRRARMQYSELVYLKAVEEMSRSSCDDPGKALLLFLIENDQRRHMASFYEDIDLNRLEYQMPFFDGEFLSLAVSLPIESTLYHRFYTRWLECFGDSITQVAWQTYPGHQPCPLPMPDNGVYQWERHAGKLDYQQRFRQMKTAFAWALDTRLPTEYFSRGRIFAVGILSLLTRRDYTYLIKGLSRLPNTNAANNHD